MSGKAYSIKEMKTIVDYLIEHKAYGKVKARTMWMEFANSQLTNRTWQSLKETFLKRILPDIHNPYYKLTIEQVNSFRQGYDVTERNKSKLEIHTVSEDSTSSSNAENQKQPDTDNAQEGNPPGEGIKCSKIPSRTRSSAETVIVDNCYETTEDIQRDLESPVEEMKKENKSVAAKSLRDCITYSEPLTPMIQEVLDDFASEPEDEPQMVIAEDTVPDSNNSENPNQESNALEETIMPENVVASDVAKNVAENVAEVVLLNDMKELSNQTKNKQVKNAENPVTENNQPETSDTNVSKDNKGDNEMNTEAESSEVPAIPTVDEIINLITDDSNTKENTPSIIDKANKITPEKATQNCSNSTTDTLLPNNPEGFVKRTSKATQNCSNSTTDTLLPNNPEGLVKRTSIETENQNKDDGSVVELFEDLPKTATRKRTGSQDTAKSIEGKKKKANENKATNNEKVKTNGSVVDTKIDKDLANGNLNKAENSENQTKSKFNNIEKPSTSKEVKSILITSNIKKPTTEIENPCLKNVSLFDEQFNNINYDTSETSEVEELTPNNVPTIEKQKPKDKEVSDVVILKSHSDTDTNEKVQKEKRRPHAVSKKQREKALANIFGFSSDPVSSHRKRRLSRHKKSTSRNTSHNHHDSPSSEWTSETDSEMYVSPPRARKNRPTRKYLKPESARILSLEEEGGLFVMYGKKIYPLVKDGRLVKNYLTYSPDSNSEEDESYWKLKYVEEKKKSDELKKLLQRSKEPRVKSKSPILPSKSPRSSKTSHNQNQQNADNCSQELCIPEQVQKQEANIPQEKIKIKFTKNDEEVHLEGHWPQIHPVLAQVVQIFHKESEPGSKNKVKMVVDAESKTNSRSSTPIIPAIITTVDPEVHERVNELEKEIFKEIEEIDKEQTKQNGDEANVTKRKGVRPRQSSSSTSVTPTKRPKRSAAKAADDKTDATKPVAETENKVASVETATRMTTRQNNNISPRKVLNESVNTSETKTIQTRGSKSKLSKGAGDDEDDVRYMLPPNTRRQARSGSNSRKEQKTQKSTEIFKKSSSPSNFSVNSLDSTQGYQDSDISPAKTDIRKKKLINQSTYALRNRNEYHRNVRRRSHPYMYCEASNDFSNSSARAPLKMIAQNSSLGTEAYRSESYQLLMPQVRNSFRSLQRIDEAAPIDIVDTARNLERNSLATALNSDVASSSNVSLPQSPELSVVENISISKDMLDRVTDYPTLNETQCNEVSDMKFCSKYIISGVDVTMPLMQQDCGIETCNASTVVNSPTAPANAVTESLLNKICTFNLSDQPMTETLNQKLRNLLLESAKKVGADTQGKENMMEVDDTHTDIRTKGNKKRCSTPRKRKATKKSAAPKIASLLEEHVEACSFSGRKSCPPVIQDYLLDENALDEQIANLTVTSENNEKRKGRKVKDVIRVKIVRPKRKSSKEKSTSTNNSKISVYTDSGINDSGSGMLLPISDSVDLIHNHSETCLLANECCGDSVEFIENGKSVISLNSNSMQSNEYTDVENMMHECFSNNAQDMKSFYIEANLEDTSDTVYHSPVGTEISHNSLITEDLSDDTQSPNRPSKWYLLSEEETINSNPANSPAATSVASFGANLKQIFPISYAVPNLSTITEISKDSDSRKPTLETEGCAESETMCSGSAFDSIF